MDIVTAQHVLKGLSSLLFRPTYHSHRCRDHLWSPKRIGVFRLDAIGDAVLNSAFLQALRRRWRASTITLVVRPDVYGLVALCPYVDEVLAFQPPRHAGPGRAAKRALACFRYARKHLWRRRFDIVFLPRWDTDYYSTAVLAYWSMATHRIGFTDTATPQKAVRNKGYDSFLTDVVYTQPPVCHEALRPMQLLKYCGDTVGYCDTECWWDCSDATVAASLLPQRACREHHPLVALGVGARDIRRRWSLQGYAQLAAWLLEQGVRVIIVGSEGGTTSCGEADISTISSTYFADLRGLTTLRQLAAVLAQCDLFIGNMSGPMHIASAVCCPVIAVSLETDESILRRFSPRGVQYEIVRARSPYTLTSSLDPGQLSRDIMNITIAITRLLRIDRT